MSPGQEGKEQSQQVECLDGKISPGILSSADMHSAVMNVTISSFVLKQIQVLKGYFSFCLTGVYTNKSKFQFKQTNKHAHVSTNSELRFHPDYIFQPDIRET